MCVCVYVCVCVCLACARVCVCEGFISGPRGAFRPLLGLILPPPLEIVFHFNMGLPPPPWILAFDVCPRLEQNPEINTALCVFDSLNADI